jgi:hypothetical protein
MVEKAGTDTPPPKVLSDKTLDEFYQWAKRLGHYHAHEAVDRFRRIK